jgi:glycosidase
MTPTRTLLLLLAAPLLQACDTRCVGANCDDVEDTDLVVDIPDDTDTTTVDPDELRDEREAELTKVRSCSVVRWYRPATAASTVEIAGAFNSWEPAPLEGPDEDGWFQIDLGELEPGFYPYKYLHGGQWETSIPATSPLQWDGGVENRQLTVPDCTRPHLQVQQAEATAEGALTATIAYALGADASRLDLDRLELRVGERAVTPVHDADAQTLTVSLTGLPPGKHTLRARAWDEAGREADNEVFTPLWVEPRPFQWTDGPMYLVFTDRFRNGDPSTDAPVSDVAYRANYTGGDLLGVLQALEDGWFEDLGVRSIWLSPLYENPDERFPGMADGQSYTGYHGYWPIEPRAVESKLGDDEAAAADRLHEVVAAAHARGIRVVLDVVLNHVHEQHVYRSLHPEWFGEGCVCGRDGCSWDDKPIECWFTPYMPDLDHTNPWITDQLVQDTLWWMRTFDLDGLRIDAVKHMHRVMTVNLRHALIDQIERGGGAHVYTVGETFTGGGAQQQLTERLGPFEMDAQFDFPFYWTVRDVFARGSSMQSLEATINAGINAWGAAPMSPFAGNHDIERLATAVANNDEGPWGNSWDRMADGGASLTDAWMVDTLAMTLAVTLTQPGVPLLYYGDEIGLAGSGDPDNRRNMTFDPYLSGNQRALLERIQRIGQARQELRGLQRGAFVPLWASQDTLAYARHHADQTTVVAVNRGEGRTVDVPLQGLIEDGTVLHDRMVDGRSFEVAGGAVRLVMGGNDVVILGE